MRERRSQEERLFGAACVRVTLERAGVSPGSSDLYLGTLADLQLDDEKVLSYLTIHRDEVIRCLKVRRSGS
ncbi:MAG: hypothetical protein HC923_07915 [Myxococcales bacterium]|nr:hypothetical protein [Myxococcales bacterium]